MPKMRSVYSSHVDKIGHDAEANELHVKWQGSGKTSVYEGVPADLAHQVMNAHSVGQALNEHIKDNYKHHYA